MSLDDIQLDKTQLKSALILQFLCNSPLYHFVRLKFRCLVCKKLYVTKEQDTKTCQVRKLAHNYPYQQVLAAVVVVTTAAQFARKGSILNACSKKNALLRHAGTKGNGRQHFPRDRPSAVFGPCASHVTPEPESSLGRHGRGEPGPFPMENQVITRPTNAFTPVVCTYNEDDARVMVIKNRQVLDVILLFYYHHHCDGDRHHHYSSDINNIDDHNDNDM